MCLDYDIIIIGLIFILIYYCGAMKERESSLREDYSEDNNKSRVAKLNLSNFKEERAKTELDDMS